MPEYDEAVTFMEVGRFPKRLRLGGENTIGALVERRPVQTLGTN